MQSNPSELDHLRGYLDDWLNYHRAAGHTPGLQVAVRQGSQLLFSAAYGISHVDTGEALTPQHLMRIASQSKTFTAVAVMQLVEDGKMRLDGRLGDYLEELSGTPSRLGEVTIRQLLSHSGGIIGNGWDADYISLLRPEPDEREILDDLIAHGVVMDPLSAFKYSNSGYNLLGMAIARGSGMAYRRYVTERIINPLGLGNTGPDFDPARVTEFAWSHTGFDPHKRQRALPHVDTRGESPCGGFYSTAEDLTQYYSAYFSGDARILTEQSKREMQHPSWPMDPASPWPAYGLGLIVDQMDGVLTFGHSGGHPGQLSQTIVVPSEELVVCVLGNSLSAPVQMLAGGLTALVRLALRDCGRCPDAERFCGRYTNLFGEVEIVCAGGSLRLLQVGAQNPIATSAELVVADDDTLTFCRFDRGEQLAFIRSPDGTLQRIEGRGGPSLWPVDHCPEPAL